MVVGLYLSTEQSTWGRDSTCFYSHLLSLMYNFNDCDNIVLAGDLNSKIGNMEDFIPEVDNLHVHKLLDTAKNKHGYELLNFLVETNTCVCNGRVTPQLNNYTYIHTRGKSVIDYIIIPVDAIKQCIEFQVKNVRDLLNTYCNVSDDA